MSNEKKFNLKLGAVQVTAAKRAARCQDCLNTVEFDGEKLLVQHSHGCPSLAQLEASEEAYGGTAVFFCQDGPVVRKTLSSSSCLGIRVAVFNDTHFR